jgi:hypothetical protein
MVTMIRLTLILLFAGFFLGTCQKRVELHEIIPLSDQQAIDNLCDNPLAANPESYESLNKLFDSLDYYHKQSNTFELLRIYIELAELMRASGNYFLGINFLRHVMAHPDMNIQPLLSAKAHNRMAAIFFELYWHNDEVLAYFDSTYLHCKKVYEYEYIGEESDLLANNLIIEAALNILEEEYHEAEELLLRALDIYNQHGSKPDLSFYGNLTKTWIMLGNYNDALILALEFHDDMIAKDNLAGQIMSADLIGETYKAMGNEAMSEEFFAKSKSFAERRDLVVDYFTIKHLVSEFEKQKADRNLALLYEDRLFFMRLTQITVFASIAILLLLTIVAYMFRQRYNTIKLENELFEARNEIDKMAIEKQEEEAGKLKNDLNDKENLLASKIVAISRINEMLIFILKKVQETNMRTTNSHARKSLSEISGLIKRYIKTDTWEEFDAIVASANSDFISRLTEVHPDLTSLERRLCLFLRMNMSTKEISDITLQNSRAIEMARHRLRTKFKLERNDSLQSYLAQFS